MFFAAVFDRPFHAYGTWRGGDLQPGSIAASGAASGAYVVFKTAYQPLVRVKVGLSYTSIRAAQANLRAENPGWDFAALARAARTVWNRRLGVIQIRGGTPAQRAIFYTALYHSLIHPSVFGDADGTYLGFDDRLHRKPTFTQYHNFAGWDMYRCQAALLAVLAPADDSDMMQSLVNDAEQDRGKGLPRW